MQCLQDSDCPNDDFCSDNRTCVDCVSSEDCSDPSFPFCNPLDSTCVSCLESSQCGAGFLCQSFVCTPGCDASNPCDSTSQVPVCNLTTQTCTQCLTSGDCSGIEDICFGNTCVNCETSAECQSKYGNVRPECDTNDGFTCKQCLDDGDCVDNPLYASANKLVCISGSCQQCRDDNNCASFPDKPACDLNRNSCVECVDNQDCAVGSFCNSNTCVECLPENNDPETGINAECVLLYGNQEPTCLAGKCVQCIDNNECPSTSPICAQTSISGTTIQANTCVGCTGDGDCRAPSTTTPVCDTRAIPTPTCVQCVDASDCPNNQQCINSKCGCNSNDDCTEPTGVCNIANNTCIPGCTTDQFCRDFYGLDYCANTVCVECISDWQCPSGGVCVSNQCQQCRTSTDCAYATNGYAVNCVDGNCETCQPSSVDTLNCPGDCQACPREKPVCQATFDPTIGGNTYSCIECANDANCATDAECRGCICDSTSANDRIIRPASLNSIQVSEKNRNSLSVQQCEGTGRSVGSATVRYANTQGFICDGPSVSVPYDVRSFPGPFKRGQEIWFYSSGYVYPDEFVITLGQCDILTDYDSRASTQGGVGGVLGEYTSTSSRPEGCVNDVNTREDNPAGSSPCCRPGLSGKPNNCNYDCGPGDKYLSFILDRDYDELFVTVYAPCQSTRWVYMVCTADNRNVCTDRDFN